MSNTQQSGSRGFGPAALIVTGVVCFAAGYMVSDITKGLTNRVPSQPTGTAGVNPTGIPASESPDPGPAAIPATAEDPEKNDDEKNQAPSSPTADPKPEPPAAPKP